jgi:HMG-box domain
VSQRWKNLPEDCKDFFKEVARKDLERYREEMKQSEIRGITSPYSFHHLPVVLREPEHTLKATCFFDLFQNNKDQTNVYDVETESV